MKPGEMVDVYKTRFKKLLRHYHNLLEDFDPNVIHHFRLEIKKLTAFLHLIYVEKENHHSKIPKDIKLFYNLLGNIMNLQLHQSRVKDLSNDLLLEIPAVYLQCVDVEEKGLKKQARQTAKNISIKDFENKLIEEVPGKLTRKMQNDFIQKNLARFHELLALSFYTDEALHEVRKIMKDLMYNLKYLDAGGLNSSVPELKSMNAITRILGDYHDLCISLSLLNSTYVTEITDANEAHVLNELKIQLQVRKDVMRIEIIELLKRLDPSFLPKQNTLTLP
jgi:CHAD domain-containing protein